MLVDIVVAAMPYFPALPQEPGRDFAPVRLKGRSGDGGRSAAVRKYMRIIVIVQCCSGVGIAVFSVKSRRETPAEAVPEAWWIRWNKPADERQPNQSLPTPQGSRAKRPAANSAAVPFTRSISLSHPIPRISDLDLQFGTYRLPAKECVSGAGVADQDRRITRAAPDGFRADAAAAHGFRHRDHFLNLPHIGNIALLERAPFDCPEVAARKIVIRDRHVALCGQRLASVAANIARAA